MADKVKTTIIKLNNENYFTWKYRMELLLIKDEVWHVITEAIPVLLNDRSNQANVDKWKKSDDKARATIGLLVEDSQLNHIRTKTTAKEMWNALKEHHEKGTLSNKVILMRQICNARMDEGGNMEEHIDELTSLFQRLVALGETQLSESWTVAMILSSLPASYSTLTTALETRPEADLTLSLVQSKLIGEYRQRKANEHIESIHESAMKVNKESVRCYFCDDIGHFKISCPKYIEWKGIQESKVTEKASLVERSQQSSQVKQNEEFLFIMSTASGNNYSNEWVVDSAATSHASGDANKFTTMSCGMYGIAKMANNSFVNILGKGTVTISMVNDNENVNSTTLRDVLFVPGIDANLLSIRKLIEDEFTVNFTGDTCEIIRGNCQIGKADCCDGLYKLRSRDAANLSN